MTLINADSDSDMYYYYELDSDFDLNLSMRKLMTKMRVRVTIVIQKTKIEMISSYVRTVIFVKAMSLLMSSYIFTKSHFIKVKEMSFDEQGKHINISPRGLTIKKSSVFINVPHAMFLNTEKIMKKSTWEYTRPYLVWSMLKNPDVHEMNRKYIWKFITRL